jgi:uncharacterized protein YjiS (DUF1127 family)
MHMNRSFAAEGAPGGNAAAHGSHSPFGIAKAFFAELLDVLWAWQQRAGDRRALGRLDDRMLSDIGIDRGTADRESMKPFWRA